MSAWQNILGVAAIGTERQELTLSPSDSLLGRALDGLDVSDREGALLGAVALASLHRQAGLGAATDSLPLPDACAVDQLPRCSTAAGRHLALMLGGEFKEVLPEWLAALRGAGRRVREEHLPALLDRGAAERALRPAVIEVSGERGRWLAAQNAAWGWASAGAEPDEWETAGRDARFSLLRSLRETEPRRAVELLSSTWKNEPAKDRLLFIQALRAGLGDEDEPFLSEALDDRSAEVRRSATDLLLCLPSSRLTQLVGERVGPLLTYRKPTLRKPLIEVDLPEDPERWQRENQLRLEFPPAGAVPQTLGKKGLWLLHAVGCVPPAFWCAAWSKRPEEVLAAAANSEWREALLSGLASASARYADVGWIEAILSDWETRQALVRETDAKIYELASRLPGDLLEAFILKELSSERAGGGPYNSTVWMLLAHRRGWGGELSRAVAAFAKEVVSSGRANESVGRHLIANLKHFALYVPPALADELSSGWPSDAEGFWQKPVEEFQTVLSFRRDMLRAIVNEEETEV